MDAAGFSKNQYVINNKHVFIRQKIAVFFNNTVKSTNKIGLII
jgi:hypothetical protein